MRVESLTLPTAPIREPSPLPPLFSYQDLHQIDDLSAADPAMREGIRYGRVTSTLPYLQQDRYGRERMPVEHPVVTVENELLRATFLIGMGGRLWSLVHKPSGRELLYRNEVLQPANLALRNAWFAGGVEWNIGTIGHSPLTCSPMHAARVELDDGTPVLRMFEYERMRGLVYQVDAWLPAGSPVLLVHVRIVNPSDDDVPLYWWSNIAVPQMRGTRVLAPARAAWQFTYDSSVRTVTIPSFDGLDRSYPARATNAADYFFALDEADRPWIAALDQQGQGLVQTSTSRLRGRKLFLWGEGAGGQHWQQWLSPEGGRYLEIQAGAARTQLEHLRMPARDQWSWVEAYGYLDAPAELVHSDDWGTACDTAGRHLDDLITQQQLEAIHTDAIGWADRAPAQVLQHGTGWGALEERLRRADGDSGIVRPGTPFASDSLGPEQEPWLALLSHGRMPDQDPHDTPLSYAVGSRWTRRLADASDWLGLLHLGVSHAHAGNLIAAQQCWQRSVQVASNPWALRNLSALALLSDRPADARRLLHRAVQLRPDILELTRELVDALLISDDAVSALSIIDELPAQMHHDSRIRLAELRAAVSAGDLPRADAALARTTAPPDLREGEDVLHQLWYDVETLRRAHQRGQPVDDALQREVRQTAKVPWQFEFRMSATPTS